MTRTATSRSAALLLLTVLFARGGLALAADPPKAGAAPGAVPAPTPGTPPAAPAPGGAAPAPPAPGKPADQATPSSTDAEEGKRHFQLGLQLFNEKVYDAALAEFQQSYALGRRPTALRNVAQCHRELRQFAEAYDSLALLLSRHGSQLKDSDKAEIRAALEELEGVTATLTLNVNVPGAAITIDDRDAGTSPIDHKIRLNVGSHRIRASKPGFDPAELQITLLVRQDASETMTLKAAAIAAATGPIAARPLGHLRIKATPSVADILIDGERVAAGRYEGDASEGDHALDVAAQGFVSVHRTIRLTTGQQVVENVALDPYVPEVPPPKSILGRLYGTFDVALLRHINGYQPLLTACGDQQVTCNQPSYPDGAGILHVGYTFDWVGVELVGAFAIDVRSESLTATGPAASAGALVLASSNVQRSESLSAVGFSGFLGLGVRATSSDAMVRVTAGISPGLSLRHYTLSRTLSNGIDATYADEGTAAAVGVMTDVALVIGASTGARFRLGLALWMDFPQGDVLSSGGSPLAATANGQALTIDRPAYVLQSGSQFLIGPTLGVQFGR